ncbi:DUF1850 domain-containing protein [Ureibacillus chungkukjangi]|uniref:Uncharacterized protein DUF1850 n=1 Tax=Ureibacillus chungkukjangi TaxID=1202712 RepID=A0A318TMQ6_9BACL|nr:DUF1850 domain-containing protein [Ureibacillus chungkukjangi]MCM3388955.1 DUF1850 domain-containing protein [Ureibacillus chungkukjangi]PYF05783.1 uncharacterized protein DUF1850 [Ureibacillus chungkukjangi]
MSKSKKKWWFWSIGLLILLNFFFIRVPVFAFEFEDKTYYLKSNHFDLSWIHSVEKEEWIETYQQNGEQMLLTETHFKTFGAGVPSQSKDVSIEDGFVKMQINQLFKELNLTVSSNVKTTIIVDEQEIPLYKYTDDYSMVHIFIEKLPIWKLAKGGF